MRSSRYHTSHTNGGNSSRVARAASRSLEEVSQARLDVQELLDASQNNEDQDVEYLKLLVQRCTNDRDVLEEKLQSEIDNPDVATNLEQIFAVTEELLAAIDKGNEAIRSKRKKKKRKNTLEGPSIELLVNNEDVFSLICMLRAPSEKRLAAALALMKFSKENSMLRNEIRSSGGMQPFLQLFRAKSTSYDLKVVCAMAVAYVLPMFVTKSDTLSNQMIGRLLECLYFLSTAESITPQDVVIMRTEMLCAASEAVNTLWTHTIKTLVIIQESKGADESLAPTIQSSATSKNFRARADQSQESIELHGIMEDTVTLIAHIAEGTSDVRIDTAYDIVADVCEVKTARPVAVREGLLSTIIHWLRSEDISKTRPAAEALRHLISIEDKYIAGWIHSQVVNERAVTEIVKLLNKPVDIVGIDMREGIAQLLSSLCLNTTTRAAVVEAKCVSYLITILYEHKDPSSKKMVHYAASALLQLAGGVILEARTGGSNKPVPRPKESAITEIGWAHEPLVQIALTHQGALRSVAIEALRVLSEDTDRSRLTRLQLCEADAAKALGTTLRECFPALVPLLDIEGYGADFHDPKSPLIMSVKDVHEALRALANIFEEPAEGATKYSGQLSMSPTEVLNKGWLDMVESDGMESLIWIATLPHRPSPLSQINLDFVDRGDLITEACRSLANLSPYLLSDLTKSEGSANWTIKVFETLDRILHTIDESIPTGYDESLEVKLSALKGLCSLAEFEPLKIRIVDKTLSKLLEIKAMSGDDSGNAANQVLLSLGLTENQIIVQLAGNDPSFLVDWFCLQRSLIIQAMAREEIRAKLSEMWDVPLSDTEFQDTIKLLPPQQPDMHTWSFSAGEIFENFTNDADSYTFRKSLREQYTNIYHFESSRSRGNAFDENTESLLVSQVFPVNHVKMERDWILNHRREVEASKEKGRSFCGSGALSERVEILLDNCFPCTLLRGDIVPINDFSPSSTFDFRALMMPQRQYFSFRREGQLLARLCEKHGATVDSVDVHWTLAFTNSSFQGEFVESLVQSLYLCPMITGLSFAKKAEFFSVIGDSKTYSDGGAGLLANLTGSLPPWVSHLTFDNVLRDKDLKSLVTILETMGKLSAPIDTGDVQSQGKFRCISIRNSPHISRDTWEAFFKLLPSSTRGPAPMPLSSLKILDLSGNKLGDEASARILELLHEKDSGCQVEKLDLSGNRIGRGERTIQVFQSYTDYYRYRQKQGTTNTKGGWTSSLTTLNLGDNDLFLGQLAIEILALLQNNALCLTSLDLSNNGLEGDAYQLVAATLPKNNTLSHLNLSGNKFSSPLVDFILHHLADEGVEDTISSLLFEDNSPPLSLAQQDKLDKFLRKMRKMAIERHIKGQDTELDDGDEIAPVIKAFSSMGPYGRHGIDTGDNMITVLFSAPLVFQGQDDNLHPFAKLDFEMERELLWQCMKEASRDIELSFDNAHHDRLLATLTKRCSCLHYSGHGHERFLPFEDGMGGPNWLDVQDIKELISRDGMAPFKFVFVSACHSGLAGETFASAGVPHVVCCRQDYELKDTAALAFTRSFYLALAVGNTVKESFEQGCKAVRATPNLRDPEKEMEKFILLPRDGNHNVPVFQASRVPYWPKQTSAGPSRLTKMNSRRGLTRRSVGAVGGTGSKSTELSVRNMIQEDPAPSAPNFFFGREVDMYKVLTALLKFKKRLVTVFGEAGIGKSALLCALCHYINERSTTIIDVEHIYFIRAKRSGRNEHASCFGLVRQLMEKVVEAGKMTAVDADSDLETMLDAICRALKNDKALIVFNTNDLLESGEAYEEMPMILNTMLYDTKHVKVVLTSRKSLSQPSIGGQVEYLYKVEPLNFENTARLFANLCPHLHTSSERNRLLKKLVHDNEYADAFPSTDWLIEPYRSIFLKLGNGNPAKIEKAAYSISPKDLRDLSTMV